MEKETSSPKLKTSGQTPLILFIGEDVSLAHVVRPLILAATLQNEYEVIFASGGRYEHLVKERGIGHHKIFTQSAESFLSRVAKGQNASTTEDFAKAVEADLSIIKELSPDLIVGDLRLSLGISAKYTKTPYISIMNAHWSPYSTLVPPPPEHPIVKILGVKIASLLMPVLTPMILKKFAGPFNAIRKAYSLARIKEYREVFTCADWTIYADIPTLAPTKNTPLNHVYIGPTFWSPDVSLPDWWDLLPADKPVVYVAMGSTGNIQIVKDLLDELHAMDIAVMLASSGRFDLESTPENVFIADYLPGIEACKRATMVICNGGTGTVNQALSTKTPILGIPLNGDQYFTMGSLANQGAGLFIRSGKINRKRIRIAVTEILSNTKYAQVCEKLYNEILQYNALEKFPEFINSLWQK